MDIYSTRERIRKENINFMNLPLRVTFYARVSTDFNVQLNSLDTYEEKIIYKSKNYDESVKLFGIDIIHNYDNVITKTVKSK